MLILPALLPDAFHMSCKALTKKHSTGSYRCALQNPAALIVDIHEADDRISCPMFVAVRAQQQTVP